MRIVSTALSILFALTALACSETSGLELVVVGESPSDLDATIQSAAAAAGFVRTDLVHPLQVKNAGAHFFELPNEGGGEKVTIETGSSSGSFHIRIGRAIYAGYSVEETAAVTKFVRTLRESGLVLSKTWSNKLVLTNDLELWLKGNLKHEA